jgi:methyl-accepting chemotaxis protein
VVARSAPFSGAYRAAPRPVLSRPLIPHLSQALEARERLAARGGRIATRLAAAPPGGAAADPAEEAALVADLDSFRVVLGKMEDAQDSAGKALTRSVDRSGAAAQWTGVGCLLALLGTGLLLSRVLGRSVAGPVTRVAEGARRIADGDLAGDDVEVRGGDELAEMARAFNRMAADLRGVIGRIQRTGATLGGHAAEISGLTWETRSAVEHLNQAVEQITAGAQEQAARPRWGARSTPSSTRWRRASGWCRGSRPTPARCRSGCARRRG